MNVSGIPRVSTLEWNYRDADAAFIGNGAAVTIAVTLL
jgi:hypothetical protein